MYNQTMIIVPYLLMGPGLFTGAMTLGVLIQTSSAFREVQSSFSLFLQNWTRITELRSIYKRLNEFETAINFRNKLRKPRKSDVKSLMELYIKLIDVLFPVFFIIGVGYYLGKKDPNFDTTFITNFAGNIGTPAMIFYTITTTGVTLDIFIEYFIYAVIIIAGFCNCRFHIFIYS